MTRALLLACIGLVLSVGAAAAYAIARSVACGLQVVRGPL